MFTWPVVLPFTHCDSSRNPRLCNASSAKGVFAELMGRIPIHVIVSSAAITGAVAHGLENSIVNTALG